LIDQNATLAVQDRHDLRRGQHITGGNETMELPNDLIAAVIEGRAVLFLGAGASRGAKNGAGDEIPLANDLAAELVDKFLGPAYRGLDFRTAYDLSCSQRDVPTVQRFIFDRLNPFQPADFHLLIPQFPWAGLLTTNYDLIVERSYRNARSPIQRLVPYLKDGDGSTRRLDQRSVLYDKLHGCITLHHEVHPPLVASTEQLIAFQDGREGQFDTFLEWAKTKSIIFVGYSFLDPNLRALFNEIIKEGDNRPRHYIANKSLRPAEATYWADRRVTAVGVSFEELLRSLDDAIPAGKRKLGLLANRVLHASSFSRFITVTGREESDDLKSYLSSMIDHVSDELRAVPDSPSKFYRGFDLGWLPIQAELDVKRTIVNEIITEQIIPTPPAERASVVVLKGHAGSGKTVTLRRVAWEAATRHGRLCFFVTRNSTIDIQRFEEIFSLTNLPIYLFVDDVSEHRYEVLELIEVVRRTRAVVRIVCAESFTLWNTSCDELEPRVSAQYEMRYLSEGEIQELVNKLETHGSLGYLRDLPLDRRIHELKYVHGRQLLVALLEATHGVPLVEIIENEYGSIYPPEAKLLYLDICSLHRFGPPVRAGLISRIHDITFEQFKERMFLPLQQIVTLRTDPKSGDYVYEARHSHIANLVYEIVLKTRDERFDNLLRILVKLNPGFTYDMDAIARLIRATNVESTVSDPNRGRQIYEAALASAGRRAVILHQRGIYEMHVANNFSELRRAEEFLEEALSIEPHNKVIKHSMAELDLRRSRMATDRVEKLAWRRSAAERAAALTPGSNNSYPHATLIKATLDDVNDALAAAENTDNDATFRLLNDSIARAEDVLRKAQQLFPNDAMLLSQEGELSSVLSQAARTEAAFKKAFEANPRSTLVARRLARIQRSKGAPLDAVATLRTSLEANPSSSELQFDLASALMDVSPDADQTRAEEILYHLRRAFNPGDRNYRAQFLFARELCIAEKYDDAKPIFAKLAEASIPLSAESGGQRLSS
jgi:SIR2-like domain